MKTQTQTSQVPNYDAEPLAYARRDLDRGLERFANMPRQDGHRRGVDIYRPEALPAIYVAALRNFRQAHGRLPDLERLPEGSDHLFAAKFFRYFPIDPNPAAKHNTLAFVPEEMQGLLAKPQRRVLYAAEDLRKLDIEGEKPFYLKISLGNANFLKVTPDEFRADLDAIVADFDKRMEVPRYGVGWGEWPYGLGPQAILVEQDVSPAMTGMEYQFFVRRAEVRLFRVQHGLWTKHVSQRDNIEMDYYFRSGERCPGTIYGRKNLNLECLSDQLDAMIAVSEAVGSHFDSIRVDFIETTRGPVLGEFTLFPGNARGTPSTPELSAALVEAHRMEPETP